MNDGLVNIGTGSVDASEENTTVIHLPVLYGGEYGLDLEFVARNAGMSADEVVDLHSGTEYPVYMMGFHTRISLPRRNVRADSHS